MSYVQGYLVPVPARNRQAYLDQAKSAVALFEEYGATRIVECWGENLPDGKVTDFRKAVAAEADENVVFSWMVWPSKSVCDEAMQKLESDPRMKMEDMPFDGRRMVWGGFEVLLDSGA